MTNANHGVFEGRYAVIPRTLIFIFNGESVLLMKGSPTKRTWPGKYNGVGGHIERGEDVVAAARRELKEESGLTVKELFFCGTVVINIHDNVGILIFVYKGIFESGELISSQEGTLEWVSVHQLGQVPLVEDVPFLLEKIMPMKLGSPQFSTLYSYDAKGELHIEGD